MQGERETPRTNRLPLVRRLCQARSKRMAAWSEWCSGERRARDSTLARHEREQNARLGSRAVAIVKLQPPGMLLHD